MHLSAIPSNVHALNFHLSNMSNLNVSHESTVSDHSETGFIFDIAPLLKKWEQNNS